MTPSALPVDAARYLSPEVIVLDEVAAGDLSGAQSRAGRAVRPRSGRGIGDRRRRSGRLAAGCTPARSWRGFRRWRVRRPRRRRTGCCWRTRAGRCRSGRRQGRGAAAATYWQVASGALAGLIDSLPPRDPVSVGVVLFGRAVVEHGADGGRDGEVVVAAGRRVAVRADEPGGGAGAGRAEAPAGLASELLVISDADVTIERPDEIAGRLSAKRVRLHILAVGDERAQGVRGAGSDRAVDGWDDAAAGGCAAVGGGRAAAAGGGVAAADASRRRRTWSSSASWRDCRGGRRHRGSGLGRRRGRR